MNPDTIGISILENNRVIYTQEFSLKLIFTKIFNKSLSSNSKEMKYYQNKLRFETFEISKSISILSKHYRCQSIFIEDLQFKGKTTIKKSNRKNKNLWKRELFINNLTKRLNIIGIKIFKVNPVYSSFIGNLQHNYTDAINASIEIARRDYEFNIKKNKNNFYPILSVKHQWKETVADVRNWKELFLKIKNLKLKYRVSLDECLHDFRVFKQRSIKSGVINYKFYG